MRFPEDVERFLRRRYGNQQEAWLAGGGAWPLVIALEPPSEADAVRQPAAVRDWVQAWNSERRPGAVEWIERRWASLGTQRIPEKLILTDAREVAVWAGDEARWVRAAKRFAGLVKRWPMLASRLGRYFDSLADYSDGDVMRLEALLAWLEGNPASGLYPRQIPLAGMDTKWLGARLPMVDDLLSAVRGVRAEGATAYERWGLNTPPHVVRMRLLDVALRERVGGLSDVAAPVDELAALDLRVSSVFIVENVQSGLCFPACDGAVVLMGLGYGVSALGGLPWLNDAECVYWGDIDTHGFAILDRLRACVPGVRSVLMDEATLLKNRELWVTEKEQFAGELTRLTADERAVYEGLRGNRWGPGVRLEQERIQWDEAWCEIRPKGGEVR